MARRPFALIAIFLIIIGLYTIHRLPAASRLYLQGSNSAKTKKTNVPIAGPDAIVQVSQEPAQNVIGGSDREEEDNEERKAKGKGDVRPAVVQLSPNTDAHPIVQLTQKAQNHVETMVAKQSKTLEAAVAEYRLRYGIPPPPGFDRWYEFAKERDVLLVDEFDTIHEMLTPFWGLKPELIRRRAREALGYDNMLLAVLVRNGEVTLQGGGSKWEREALQSMMDPFRELLPDMDLAFNLHDEPRVVLQHDDLSRLVATAKDKSMPAAASASNLTNSFSKAPDMDDGKSIREVASSHFNAFPRQQTWSSSRMSCPPTSPARTLDETEVEDDTSGYCFSDLCFIGNTTAFTDICATPSLRTSYGFFDRPNAYSVSHDLVPVFSQSKLSSYSDIVYPSQWYWAHRVPYSEEQDVNWEEKTGDLFWRGSTTGGFSRWGAWRRHHRQRIVDQLNGSEEIGVLAKTNPGQWRVEKAPRERIEGYVNVTFSHIGQCDPGDCDAERHHFELAPYAPQEEAWQHKLILDMDGNAFSGRYQAFLRSRSLVLKFALFREWSADWLVAWRHFVPLTLKGMEWAEIVRFFLADDQDEEGSDGGAEARNLAEAGSEWAGRVLRNEDMEAWFFRLLLEWVPLRLS